MNARGAGWGKTRRTRIPVYARQFHTIARSHEEEIPNRLSCLSYRGTSLLRNNLPVGPSSSPMPRDLGGSYGGGCFL